MRKLIPAAAVLVALVVLVVAVAVVSATKHHSAAAAHARAIVTQDGVPGGHGTVGSRLGSFSITDVDGRSVRVVAGKPGALFFFAGWCGECVPEAQALGRLQRQVGSRAQLVAVSPDPSDSVGALRAFRRQVGTPRFPFVWNSDGSLGRQLNVSAWTPPSSSTRVGASSSATPCPPTFQRCAPSARPD